MTEYDSRSRAANEASRPFNGLEKENTAEASNIAVERYRYELAVALDSCALTDAVSLTHQEDIDSAAYPTELQNA